ncbi:hypothetical protein EDM52_17975 [Brevibacillus invocatus]|uniref:SPOR domain-containing protein n=1 Tax=Brevibacillus invocatus TaxID=173959 RepID=A0A3M8C3U6_9BACL|nr:hypothetical protein [Brevibacillus invocatus]RNB70133.1 hypothetical protein EDM52_17975 [Brevibacillus invocatus]
MTVSGTKGNNLRVKVNGQNWQGTAREKEELPRANHNPSPKRQIQGPSLPLSEIEKMSKRDDAWDRMMQIRSAAAAEPERQHESYTAPEHDYRREYIEEDSHEWSSNRFQSFLPKGAFLRTLLTTGGAIAIGLVFGIMVLTIFSQEQFSTSYRTVLSDTVETLTAQPESPSNKQTTPTGPVLPGDQGSAAQPTASTGAAMSLSLQLPEVKMHVAQVGVFQLDAPEEAATQSLTKLGLPHLLYNDSTKQYMFAAATTSREAVLGFASNLKTKGLEVFVKEFSFPAYQGEVKIEQSAEPTTTQPNLDLFFTAGRELTEALSAQSGLVITSAQPAIAPADTATLKEKHRKFLEAGKVNTLPAEWQPYFQEMVNGLNQAVAARDKMAEASGGKKTESAESYAWQVQGGILTYLESYTKWLQQLDKGKSI